ncbi:hypothetical protein DH2020_015035 [Rehmannia glutinosa]|uniref:Auxin response factor n=1 Tax=Rehmannia glutinosa TaxID=99300 RepID=A0ABR0X1Z2_REHGL
MEETEKCVDSQFWHVCAGNTVQMPPVNSKVFYFPQGHFEQCSENVDLGNSPSFPHCIPCKVSTIKLLAKPVTDEVSAKIRLVPDDVNTLDSDNDGTIEANVEKQDKILVVTKTLSRSDALGTGFLVPKHCRDVVFRKSERSSDPEDQMIHMKDIHGRVWEFKHPDEKRSQHRLTSGWRCFVKDKKPMEGDSIIFMWSENSGLCVGIRRKESSRGQVKVEDVIRAASLAVSGNPFEAENGDLCVGIRRANSSWNWSGSRGRVRVEDVIEAASLAASGTPFEVVYYPRAGTPEFCVNTSLVTAAMRVRCLPGMRFKMAFETEDWTRTSWFIGNVVSVEDFDPVRWPGSPWRLLQVKWDEPGLLQNMKHISPWLVELESHMPTIDLPPFLPPPTPPLPKKMRLGPQHPDFDGKVTLPAFSNNQFLKSYNFPVGCLSDNAPAGMQGARHSHHSLALSNLPNLSNIQSNLLPVGFLPFDRSSQPTAPSNSIISKPGSNQNMSHLRNSAQESKKSYNDGKAPKFMLFGQPIHTEEQISSMSRSSDTVLNSSSVGNTSDGSGSVLTPEQSSCEGSQTELGLETGNCQVFMESEDVGRTMDLSLVGSYEELYEKLRSLFGINISDIRNRVVYRDTAGAVRQLGDEPFSDFVKTGRRLTILPD